MYPTLFHVVLPGWRIPLGVVAAAVVVACGITWLLLFPNAARRERALAGFAALAALFGFLGYGRVLVLDHMPVHSYGVLLSCALLLGWFTARSVGRSLHARNQEIDRACLVAVVGGLVGARLGYVATHLGDVSSVAVALNARNGGLHWIGAVVGATAALHWARPKETRVWLDRLTPAALVTLSVVRVGDYLYGSRFGTPLPAGAPSWLEKLGEFPRWAAHEGRHHGAAAWLQHVIDGQLEPQAAYSLPVHPIQLYEGGLALAVCVGTLRLVQRGPFPGATFLAGALGYTTLRFSIDWLAADDGAERLGPAWFAALGAALHVGLVLTAYFRGPAPLFDRTSRWTLAAVAVVLAGAPFVAQLTRESRLHLTLTQYAALAMWVGVAVWWRRWQHASKHVSVA